MVNGSSCGAKRLVRRQLLGALSHLVDGVLAIGRLNRQYWIEQGFDPAKVYSMPYAVDNERFRAGFDHWPILVSLHRTDFDRD